MKSHPPSTYRATATEDEDGFFIQFNEFENIFTGCRHKNQIQQYAQEALDLLLLDNSKHKKPNINLDKPNGFEILVTPSRDIAKQLRQKVHAK